MGRILVVGGGPAGMAAAVAAGRAGVRVLLLEKMTEPGRKLLLTGGGRCNLTNDCDLPGLITNMPGNGRFLYPAFSRFGPDDLRRFLLELGLPTTVEAGGRVFPASGRSRDVISTLRLGMERAGAVIRTGTPVTGLLFDRGRIDGVRTAGGDLEGTAVILSTGGLSYPGTGSTGDGYRLAASAGHRIVPPRPSLVPLETAETWPRKLQGLSLPDVRATLAAGGERGELLFTHWGISGPLVARLSRTAVPLLEEGKSLGLTLDLAPFIEPGALEDSLMECFARHGRRSARNALAGLLPERLLLVILALAEVAEGKPANQITRGDRLRIARLVKRLPLTVTRTRPLDEAMVTMGGIETGEVNPRTMASRLSPGLYFAGELLDVDGYTGGFNLQAAFSTGFLAGRSAAAGE